MAKPKVKKKIKKHVFKDPRIEEVVETEIEFMCPIRGLVKQKVKVKKLKKMAVDYRSPIKAVQDDLDALDKDDLTSYDEPEETVE